MGQETKIDEDTLIGRYVDDYVPDDPDEIEEKKTREFRGSEKAEVIRSLIARGMNPAQIKLYGPGILRKRERDGIAKIEEESGRRKRRVLGRPMAPRTSRRGRGR